MKNIIYLILFAIILNMIGYIVIQQTDVSWENRAKNAGYYEILPDNMKK